MRVQVVISLAEGDVLSMTPDEAAEAVLTAVGGDPHRDSCDLSAHGVSEIGTAGRPA
jgi:hypothetical protein